MTSTKLSYLSNSTILFTGYTLLSLSLLPNEVVVGLADIITLLVLLHLVLCSLLLFPLLQQPDFFFLFFSMCSFLSK